MLLVHGFNVSDPMTSIGRLVPAIIERGLSCEVFDYGDASLLDVRIANDNIAYALLSQVRALRREFGRVVMLGHSNGCALIHMAAKLQTVRKINLFDRVVYVSPALNSDARLPPELKRCDVYHTRNDDAVWWSKLLFFHPWGAMGRTGAKTPGYVNHDWTDRVSSHSEWFSAKNVFLLGAGMIDGLANEAVVIA